MKKNQIMSVQDAKGILNTNEQNKFQLFEDYCNSIDYLDYGGLPIEYAYAIYTSNGYSTLKLVDSKMPESIKSSIVDKWNELMT